MYLSKLKLKLNGLCKLKDLPNLDEGCFEHLGMVQYDGLFHRMIEQTMVAKIAMDLTWDQWSATKSARLEDVACEFFDRKARWHGFVADEAEVHTCEIKNMPRHDTEEIPMMDLTAQLRIFDEEQFRESVYNGVGRHGAFGCGLVLPKSIEAAF